MEKRHKYKIQITLGQIHCNTENIKSSYEYLETKYKTEDMTRQFTEKYKWLLLIRYTQHHSKQMKLLRYHFSPIFNTKVVFHVLYVFSTLILNLL